MHRIDFIDGLNKLDPLISLVEMAARDRQVLVKVGIDPNLLMPTIGGAIVLMTARLENFLKEVGNAALEQYQSAAPPIGRSMLPEKLQVEILSQNIRSATNSSRFGKQKSNAERIAEIQAVASQIVDDQVWGNEAIQTYSNPNSETVGGILRMLGVIKPWPKIQSQLDRIWTLRQKKVPNLKSVPDASAELQSIMTWRNTAAHTGGALSIGPHELLEARHFIECLGVAIDRVLKAETHAKIKSLASKPAVWP